MYHEICIYRYQSLTSPLFMAALFFLPFSSFFFLFKFNSTGNAHEYWDMIWTNTKESGLRSMQGGYVWDWVDQALTDPKDKQRKMCYGGDFGIESGVADAQFCINGLIFANRKFHRE